MLRLVAGRLGMGDKLPANEEYYACPCCLTAYNRPAVIAGVLTEEHVPPQGLGGRGLVLTCVKCNSNSGTSFDAQYLNVNGQSGYFAHSLNAHGHQGEPCPRCGRPIVREQFMNRGSHFCRHCQRVTR